MSYQSGGVPTFNTSQAGGEDVEAEAASSIWETRFGMRVDMLAASAYILGPISGAPRVVDPITQVLITDVQHSTHRAYPRDAQ